MMPKYHINLFWSEPGGAWVADVPDLQSCSAFGDTPAEALAEIEQAIHAWLAVAREHGLPILERRYRVPTRAAAERVPDGTLRLPHRIP
jgi:predicted RNase H-like HicB family nuclease